MRESLCILLACPACRGGDWSVEATAKDPREILNGQVRCRSCGRSYVLQNGAVDFVLAETLSDIQRLDRERSAESDRNILEQKRRGEFVGGPRQREEQYRRETFERTDFLFRDLEYNDTANRTVLDLGCGEPWLASRFAQLGFNVIALDFTCPRLDQAHDYFEREGIYFDRLLALMSRIPLRDQSVDIVFSHASLHHTTPNRPGDFRWFDPNNMVDTLREVRRVLKPDGLFLVCGEGEYPEELSDEQRHLEREAQRTGCYEAFYKISEYERAFHKAGVCPNLWAQWHESENRLRVGTFLGGHFRQIVTPGDGVNSRSHLLLSAPALKRTLDSCLGKWARVRPWPGAIKVPRLGGWLRVRDQETFVEGWHQPEGEAVGQVRWMGRESASVAFQLDFAPVPWNIELKMKACWLLGEFDTVIFVERDGRTVAKEVHQRAIAPTANDQQIQVSTHLEAGRATLRCIRDGQMRVRVCLNGDCLTTLELPSTNEFHSYSIDLPADKVRALNHLTLEPSYAFRPCDCGPSPDDRWLSCQVADIRIVPIEED